MSRSGRSPHCVLADERPLLQSYTKFGVLLRPSTVEVGGHFCGWDGLLDALLALCLKVEGDTRAWADE